MFVQYTFQDGVAEIRLKRAEKRNAISSDLLAELSAAVEKAAQQAGNRLTLFSAEGTVFCAGMDLNEMQQRTSQVDAEERLLQDSRKYRDLLVAILNLSMPTLAIVQGPAVAGGVGIVLACDLVIGSEECRFALPEPKRGIVAAMVTPLLVYRVGVAAASHVLLSGEMITAEQAVRLNLLHRCCKASQLESEVAQYSASILTGAPKALAETKRQIRSSAPADLIEQLDQAVSVSARVRSSDEAHEGLRAFLEKRDPNW